MSRSRRWVRLLAFVVAVCAFGEVAAGLSDTLKKDLESSQYVYIASTRKNGSLSKPAEIWFLYQDGAVYVGTPATTWRARRIKAGRPQAKIWVGKPDGASFTATGAIVKDAAVQEKMFAAYAKKYTDGWAHYEQNFRNGFKDGSRVLIKYTPNSSQ
jgi:hypothetical protein